MLVGAFSAFGLAVNSYISFTPGGIRNDFGGVVGCKFTVTTNVLVTGLGIYNPVSTNVQAHSIGIWDADGNLLCSNTVSLAGAGVGFQNALLSTPVTLIAGNVYYRGALEWPGGDVWSDLTTNYIEQPMFATFRGGCDFSGLFDVLFDYPYYNPGELAFTSQTYVGVNLVYGSSQTNSQSGSDPQTNSDPQSGSVAWFPGVRGGIPNYTTTINVKNAPYNAYGDGVHDDTAAIQRALTAATAGGSDNSVSPVAVYLPTGTYLVTNGFSWSTSGVVVRGDGPNLTVLKATQNVAGFTFFNIHHDTWAAGPFNITSGFNLGSTNITLDNVSNVASNSFIFISQMNPPFVSAFDESYGAHDNPTRLMQQVDRVVAVNGNIVTLERPLYADFTLAPQVNVYVPTEYSGIENLTVWCVNTNAYSSPRIYLTQTANCWVKNVSSTNSGSAGIELEDSFADTVQDCIIWDAFNHSSGHGYALYCFDRNSDHLFVNNIIYRARHSMILEGGGCGIVYAYNYAFGTYQDEAPNWLSEDTDLHGGHPFFNLFEGNVTTKIVGDYTHGSSGQNTFFRECVVNHSSQTVTNSANPREIARYCIDFEQMSYSNNVIGCVLGQPGDAGLRNETNGMNNTTLCTYHWGGSSPGSISFDDTKVWPGQVIDGNYDYIGGGTVWTNGSHAIPNSLFLTSRPSWWNTWGNTPWPPIGSDLTPMVNPLPAQLRLGQAGSVQQSLPPPSKLQVFQ